MITALLFVAVAAIVTVALPLTIHYRNERRVEESQREHNRDYYDYQLERLRIKRDTKQAQQVTVKVDGVKDDYMQHLLDKSTENKAAKNNAATNTEYKDADRLLKSALGDI